MSTRKACLRLIFYLMSRENIILFFIRVERRNLRNTMSLFVVDCFLIPLMQRKLEWFQYRFFTGACTRNHVFGSFPINEPIKPLTIFQYVRTMQSVCFCRSKFVCSSYVQEVRAVLNFYFYTNPCT